MPTDLASVERGKRLVATIADCKGCHGENLAGGPIISDPAIGSIYAMNLTPGKGGTSNFTDADFVRAIRHGVKPDGHGIFIMPADDYHNLSEADLGAVIAYLRTVPAVDNETPPPQLGPLGRVLWLAGALPSFAAERIDHTAPFPTAPAAGVTAEYGGYLVSVSCQGCHGPGLSGGLIPGAPPDAPPARNLTPSGELVGWSEADFITAVTTGKTPDGGQLNEWMSYKTFSGLTDDELKALWAYLKTVPAKEAGTR
ncbi:MAG: c-type cytochrome [Chloroflexi bacterium]|nr:c-type cytochrome [Chloroflexota bacterium]